MTDKLYADISYGSLIKRGQVLCGDHVERIDNPDGSVVLVLADGLGSGVKACILSTLTSTIISRMIAEKLPISFCVHAIAEALPVCSVRKVAYSTFTVINIQPSGKTYVIQYDNPSLIFIRNGEVVPVDFAQETIDDKLIESAELDLEVGDMLITMSDGVDNAGVNKGMSYEFKWGRDNVAEYMAPLNLAGLSARTLNGVILEECRRRYGGAPYDDTTSLVVSMRTRETVNLLIGRPQRESDEKKLMTLFFTSKGRLVVCGSEAESLASNYAPKTRDIELYMKTDGIPTLNRVLEYLKDYLKLTEGDAEWETDFDEAGRLSGLLFEEATDINIFVGQAISYAPSNTALSFNLNIRMQIVRELVDSLKKLGKNVRVTMI